MKLFNVMTIATLALSSVAYAEGAHDMHQQHAPTKSMDAHAGHNMGSGMKGVDNASTRSYMAGMTAMHKNMDITYTGDSDIDFLRGMIAHHKGAVDMAQTVLQYGQDAQVRRMAKEIIRAQNLEISWMENWLAQLEANGAKVSSDTPRGGKWNDKNWAGDTWLNER